MKSKINRRDFLAKSSIGLMATSAGVVNLGNSFSTKGIKFSSQELPKIKEYRMLGRTGFKVSDIGCGCILTNAETILRSLLSAGINFIDTSESLWQNQEVVGKVVKEVDREAIFINTKISVSENESADEIVIRIKKFLERTGLTYLNGMMLWNVNSIKEIGNPAFHNAFERLKKEKLVQFSGVSCHGSSFIENPEDSMESIISACIESDRYDLVMFVYNYVQHQMGENILKLCDQKNVGSLLMKTDPFGGYFLNFIEQVNESISKNDSVTGNLKIVYDKIIRQQKEAKPFLEQHGYLNDSNYKKAAISFALNNPQVSSALITFRNFEDVNDYLNLSGARLDHEKVSFIDSLKKDYGNLYCRHACGQCEIKCPFNVPINRIMRYNHYFMAQERKDYAVKKYRDLPGVNAAKCVNCEGLCEQACPYKVSIRMLLSIAHQNLNSVV